MYGESSHKARPGPVQWPSKYKSGPGLPVMLDPVSDMTKHITKNTGLVCTASHQLPHLTYYSSLDPTRVIALLSSDDCYLSPSNIYNREQSSPGVVRKARG